MSFVSLEVFTSYLLKTIMKNKKASSYLFNSFIVFLFSLILILTSCKKECEEPETIFTSALALDFLDRNSNDYLVKENSSKFSMNDVKLYNESGASIPLRFELNILPEMANNRYYRVSFSSLFKTGDDMMNEVNKRLFIDFKNDRDTIDYSLKVRNNECGSSFEYLKVNYNGVLVGNTGNTTFIAVKVIKD